MYISKFSRMSTTVCPGFYASVVYVSDGNGEGADPAEVAETLGKDRDSIDMVAFDSEDGDVLDCPLLYKLIKQVRPKGLGSTVVTAGGNPAALDDLLGADYADRVCFMFCGKMTEDQIRSVMTVKDYGYPFDVTVGLVPGKVDEATLAGIAENCDGCKGFYMKSSDPRFGNKSYNRKELEALARSVKGLVRHPVLM